MKFKVCDTAQYWALIVAHRACVLSKQAIGQLHACQSFLRRVRQFCLLAFGHRACARHPIKCMRVPRAPIASIFSPLPFFAIGFGILARPCQGHPWMQAHARVKGCPRARALFFSCKSAKTSIGSARHDQTKRVFALLCHF